MRRAFNSCIAMESRVANPTDVTTVRRTLRKHALELGFSEVDAVKLATAVSELARNALEHGGGGTIRWRDRREEGRVGLEAVFTDEGAGIEDVERALQDGFTTGDGLGVGLPGARRLVDELTVTSEVGVGTEVRIVKWTKAPRRA